MPDSTKPDKTQEERPKIYELPASFGLLNEPGDVEEHAKSPVNNRVFVYDVTSTQNAGVPPHPPEHLVEAQAAADAHGEALTLERPSSEGEPEYPTSRKYLHDYAVRHGKKLVNCTFAEAKKASSTSFGCIGNCFYDLQDNISQVLYILDLLEKSYLLMVNERAIIIPVRYVSERARQQMEYAYKRLLKREETPTCFETIMELWKNNKVFQAAQVLNYREHTKPDPIPDNIILRPNNRHHLFYPTLKEETATVVETDIDQPSTSGASYQPADRVDTNISNTGPLPSTGAVRKGTRVGVTFVDDWVSNSRFDFPDELKPHVTRASKEDHVCLGGFRGCRPPSPEYLLEILDKKHIKITNTGILLAKSALLCPDVKTCYESLHDLPPMVLDNTKVDDRPIEMGNAIIGSKLVKKSKKHGYK